MPYTPPVKIEFDLHDGIQSPTLPVSFNFGADLPPIPVVGKFNVQLDDVAGEFHCKVITNFGAFNVTLDDCVGFFQGNYDSNVKRSLFNDVNSKQESTKSARFSTEFLQSNATKNVISATSCQDSTNPINETTASVEQNTLKISTDKLSAQDSTFQIDTQVDFKQDQAISKNVVLSSIVETALSLGAKTNADLQQLIPIDSRFKFVVEDVNDTMHVFNVSLNKQMPSSYWYTPAAVFMIGKQLTSRQFSTTKSIYQSVSPVAFDLVSCVSNSADFDLGLSDVKPVTTVRTIFDSVSTYVATPDFVYPFTDAKKQLTESVQRGGYRLSTTVATKKATSIGRKSCFKSEKTKWIYSQRQVLRGTVIDPPRPPPYFPPDHITVTIPTKQVYQMKHSLSVTLEDLTPIEVDSVKLSLDNDSFAWSFSANLLDLTQLNLVKQPLNAPPVVLVITIDGNVFKMLVEKITRNRSFAKNSISLSGRSLSALLSQPYEMPRSATQSDLMTVQQLAALELPFDWSLNWNCQDWVIPSGAFSYTSKTPIQVISEIAASIGAIVVPSRNSKTLTVIARYSVLPWYFDTTTPDLVIPDAAIISLSYRNIVPMQANAVYVHGSEIGGILSFCRLNGTAGEKLSATQTNSLMTDMVGTRQLGEKILADNYEQPAIQSVSMSLGGDYPFVNVGVFVRINIDGGQVRGVVNSVSIDASLDKVSQTIQIGNESTNVWTAFREMLPSSPLLVGTVASVDGETSLVTLIDGGVIRCRGVGVIGEKWYIRNGALESKAPSLTLSEIVI